MIGAWAGILFAVAGASPSASAPAALPLAGRAPDPGVRAAFDRAADLAASGDATGADRLYVDVYSRHPHDPLAPYALFEDAELRDGALEQPRSAFDLFRRLARDWPTHRLARAAMERAQALAGNLTAGAAPLIAYEAIVSAPDRSPAGLARCIARMEALLASCPTCPFADRATLWLADRYADAGASLMALATYEGVASRWPGSPAAPEALRAEADLFSARGQPAASLVRYRRLGAYGGRWAELAREQTRELERARFERASLWGAALYLLVFLSLHCVALARRDGSTPGQAARPRCWRIPIELRAYLLPAALLTALAAGARSPQVFHATAFVAAGGAVIAGSSGLVLRRRGAPRTWRALLFRAVAIALAVCALLVIAIERAHLEPLLLHTLRYGPDVPI